MEKWSTQKLGDIVSHKKGFAFKSDWFTHLGVPVVKVTNFNDGSVDLANLVYVHENIAIAKESYNLVGGDVVIQTVGSWPSNPESVVGKVVRIPNVLDGSLLNQNAVILKPKPEIRNDYLFYLLKDRTFKGFIINTAQGAANQASITLDSIFRFEFYLPPFKTQQKIAAILSAYDDLIENNKRRITLLEKMAEEIYREWFVRMRFPGHEKTKFVKGVPEGWKLEKIKNAFEFIGGGTPSKTEARYWDQGDVNWFTPSDITASKGIFLSVSGNQCTEEGVSRSSAKIFPPYSIMMTSRATIGAIGINTSPACTNQGFITCIPNEEYPLTYLYQWLKLSKVYFELISGGATFLELIKSTFKKIEILSPPKILVQKFDQQSLPLFNEIENLLNQIHMAEKTRDALLPRLISGKLSVENLDIQLPPSMKEDIAPERVETAHA